MSVNGKTLLRKMKPKETKSVQKTPVKYILVNPVSYIHQNLC